MKPPALNTRNFKKKSNVMVTQPPRPSVEILSELKRKINHQKQMMNKSGKRFREPIPYQLTKEDKQLNNEMRTLQCQTVSTSPAKTAQELGTRTKIVTKQEISLAELGNSSNFQDSIMSSSRVFQKEIELQKKRGNELLQFLKSIELEGFFESFMESGYDDLDTLIEIQTEELNYMMMRAFQQDKLMTQIKKLRKEKGIDDIQVMQTPLISSSSTIISKRIRPKSAITTTPSTPSHSRAVQNKKQQPKQQLKQQLSSKSFLYMCGSSQWSVQSQIRRACSTCFKVSQDIQKKGDCYYCPECFKFVAEDPLIISLSSFMFREYHDV